jgi:membrane protease YdiL (CAAX protease family)
MLYRRQPVRTLGWGKTFRPSFQLGLGLVALIIFLHGKIFAIINHMSGDLAVLFLALLAIALLEESVFRGFIFIRLTAGFGDTSGLVMTALLSTIWQAALLVDFNAATGVVLPGLAVILVQGLVLGWVMKKSGHVIAPALYAAISNMILFLP